MWTKAIRALMVATVCLTVADGAIQKLAHNGVKSPKATTPVSVRPLADPHETTMTTSTEKKDVFKPLPTNEPLIASIIDKFMGAYAKEIGHSSLSAEMSSVLKAERTDVRSEMKEKQVDAEGLGIDFVEEATSQQYRVFMLVKYQFDSSMFGRNRPYVTVLRLTVDCYNATTDAVTDAAAAETNDDVAANSVAGLSCDVLEHVDLPRRNESSKSVPTYIQRQIFHSAPKSYIHNHSLNVYYDAVEAQDLAYDDQNNAIENRDTMHYVRFRVKGGSFQDCVIAIEHTNGVNTLRFQDTACYDEANQEGVSAASKLALTKANLPMFVLIASIAGAFVAMLVIWRQRRSQRSGYSYLHSNTSKLSHVPTQPGTTTNTDAAIAC